MLLSSKSLLVGKETINLSCTQVSVNGKKENHPVQPVWWQNQKNNQPVWQKNGSLLGVESLSVGENNQPAVWQVSASWKRKSTYASCLVEKQMNNQPVWRKKKQNNGSHWGGKSLQGESTYASHRKNKTINQITKINKPLSVPLQKQLINNKQPPIRC